MLGVPVEIIPELLYSGVYLECSDRLPVRRACAAARQAGRTQTGVTALIRINTFAAVNLPRAWPARQAFGRGDTLYNFGSKAGLNNLGMLPYKPCSRLPERHCPLG